MGSSNAVMLGSSVNAETQSISAVSSTPTCTGIWQSRGEVLHQTRPMPRTLLLYSNWCGTAFTHSAVCDFRERADIAFLSGHACCCGGSVISAMSAVSRAECCCSWGPRWLLMQLASPSANRPCSPSLPGIRYSQTTQSFFCLHPPQKCLLVCPYTGNLPHCSP